MALVKRPVYLGALFIGEAATWSEVAAVLAAVTNRSYEGLHLSDYGFEAPNGFFMNSSLAASGSAPAPLSLTPADA